MNTKTGFYDIAWSGRNQEGAVVPSGVYVYVLKAGNRVESKKMTLLR